MIVISQPIPPKKPTTWVDYMLCAPTNHKEHWEEYRYQWMYTPDGNKGIRRVWTHSKADCVELLDFWSDIGGGRWEYTLLEDK